MAKRTPRSAPGPDELSYGFWVADETCTKMLYECMMAWADGATPPRGFNDGLVTSISQRALRAGERVYAAPPEQLRPLTISNCSQKLITKGINFVLE